MNEKKSLSTEPYRGVRDLYPEDMFIENYIFDMWRKTCESFGYVEYNASILEPADLYRAKSSEEIVNEQTYTFTDRGDREVTLRPEMTPTVARMIAGKRRNLKFPVRWYSIANVFRYERPQRGRLREHFQLNADIFGVSNTEADTEVISLAYSLLKNFGLKDEQFEIRINSRKLLEYVFTTKFSFSKETIVSIKRLLDQKEKLENNVFLDQLKGILGSDFESFWNFWGSDEAWHDNLREIPAYQDIQGLCGFLLKNGIKNIVTHRNLVRGFEYYSGIVFEIFDTNPENRRSLFGGGRYDNLTELFGGDKVPAVGFGMGDVTMRDTLETHGLLPKYTSPITLYICVLSPEYFEKAQGIASLLRKSGISVAVDLSGKKVGDQIQKASKEKIPYIICVGEEEITSGRYKLKKLDTGEETLFSLDELSLHLKQQCEK